MSSEKSYAQILKASSIMGGAAGINLLLGMVRVKFAAVLIGSAGVGLIASFTAIQGLISAVAGLGIQSSAVRDIAAAVAKGDLTAVGRAVVTLRRICWLTGLGGMASMMLLSPVISQFTFGNGGYAVDIAALGVIILLANLSGGQMALIHGMRRIGDMARANIAGAALATVSAIGFYSWLGLRGIVPSLIVVAAVQLALSWLYARRIDVPQPWIGWRETFNEAGGMVRLGLVLMWTGLMGSAVTYFTVTLISYHAGVEAVGIYGAAFALSGVLVNFVLSAMGADYYPRLTGLADDQAGMNRLVNEQTEVALLLALPGLIATLALAPWIVQLFYSPEFLPAVDLLRWFILGCLGRVIAWPLGFVMLALGKARWFLLTETTFNLMHVLLVTLGMAIMGIEGVAVAFFAMYLSYTAAVFFVARKLTGFGWSRTCCEIFCVVAILLSVASTAAMTVPRLQSTFVGLAALSFGLVYSLRGLVRRLPSTHRIVRILMRAPALRTVAGLDRLRTFRIDEGNSR